MRETGSLISTPKMLKINKRKRKENNRKANASTNLIDLKTKGTRPFDYDNNNKEKT